MFDINEVFSSSRIPIHNHKIDINVVFPFPEYPPTITSLISMWFFQFSDTHAQSHVWYQCSFPVPYYLLTMTSLISRYIFQFPNIHSQLQVHNTMYFFQFLDTHAQSHIWYQCNFVQFLDTLVQPKVWYQRLSLMIYWTWSWGFGKFPLKTSSFN